ncbi:MAG: 50S ribosomal protein L6 [Clostridia bacterium]
MSRVGEKPIDIPDGVKVGLSGSSVSVSGLKGDLNMEVPQGIGVTENDGVVLVERKRNDRKTRSLHGLIRTLVANMIHGVSQGFSKALVIHGTGYRAAVSGNSLNLTMGYSHPVTIEVPEGIEIETPSATRIVVRGADKQLVGQVAADIRSVRPPEPYHGFGIRYDGERVRMKEGKSAASAG